MGDVYLAQHPRLPRCDALKILSPAASGDNTFRERFGREAAVAAALSHPNIVRVYDRGEFDGQLWISMEYVDGTDAARLMRDRYPAGMPADEAIAIITAVARALDYAHQHGLLHRDVKPANILLSKRDDDGEQRVFLADFGIARELNDPSGITATNLTVGTVAYAAPEQLMGADLDGRADQYALASTAFHLLAGAPPYHHSNPVAVISQHLSAAPPKLSDHRHDLASLDEILSTAMAKDPNQRFPRCVDFAKALTEQLGDGSISDRGTQADITVASPTAVPDIDRSSGTKKRRWQRPGFLIPALGVIAVLIGAGGFTVFAPVKDSQRHDNKMTATAPPNTGPFTGTYTADFGPDTNLDGKPWEGAGAAPATETWGVRSVCRPAGCVATASRIRGQTTYVSTLVFDDVGGRWMAVGIDSGTCLNAAPDERWEVVTLQPRPDGTLSGESSITDSSGCVDKRTVTFTRIGDVDVNSLPDPASQPPRLASPAEALHGRYHDVTTYSTGIEENDFGVRTDCLRTGERCMSSFHNPNQERDFIFGNGKWTRNEQFDAPCSIGGTTHVAMTGEFPLPQPRQNPITLLTGHGHQGAPGNTTACAAGGDYDEKFTRTGD
jgi:serine/threonine-protein kinase